MIKTSLVLFLICACASAYAALQERPLFTMKKSHNPENIMVIYAQTDENCEFKPFDSGSYLNYYWLMDNKDRKRVHPLIKKGIADRVEFKQSKAKTGKEFEANLNDLDEVKHDLPSTKIEVTSSKKNTDCVTTASMKLGPSGENQKIDLDNTYCDVDKNMFGVPTGCNSLKLSGKSEASGKEVSVKFDKKD